MKEAGRFNSASSRGLSNAPSGASKRAPPSLPDVCDTNAPLSSAVAFLAEELLSSKYLESFLRTNLSSETAARLPGLLRQFRLGEILAAVEPARWANPMGRRETKWFSRYPLTGKHARCERSDVMGLAAGWLLLHSDEMFAARSWPWTLLREASFTVQGKGRYTDQALTEIYESSETGPLGYLTVAQVLSQMQPPLARKFAARGLERLSTEDFRRDCRLFLTGDAVLSQCCQRLAAALRELDDEQVAALAKLQSPVRGEFIRECARRLRAAKDQPVMEALAPALDSYWEGELKEQVATALRAQAFDPVRAFKEGLAAYQDVVAGQVSGREAFCAGGRAWSRGRAVLPGHDLREGSGRSQGYCGRLELVPAVSDERLRRGGGGPGQLSTAMAWR